MHPFLYENSVNLRKYLLEKNIYSLFLWPTVNWNGAKEYEKEKVLQTVMLPIDKRYSQHETKYIMESIKVYEQIRVLKKKENKR